jgi:hypothetical protein
MKAALPGARLFGFLQYGDFPTTAQDKHGLLLWRMHRLSNHVEAGYLESFS